MQVSFNPINNNYKTPSFAALKRSEKKQEEEPSYIPPTRDEILTAKTKKAVSECKYVVIAIGMLYFAMKKNLKVNKIKNQERKLAELAKMEAPVPELIKPEIAEKVRSQMKS